MHARLTGYSKLPVNMIVDPPVLPCNGLATNPEYTLPIHNITNYKLITLSLNFDFMAILPAD